MVCRAGIGYSGNDKTNVSWSNWSGDVDFSPALLRVPKHGSPAGGADAASGPPYLVDPRDGLASLVEAVADATDKKQELHVIGNGWAFEDCAKSDGVMVSLANLSKQLHDVLDPRNGALTDNSLAMQNDPFRKKRLVHFEAGIRIFDLCEALDQQNLAMPTLGGSNGQSLAGAISTSTHGGDWNQPPFPDVVRAVHLVTTGGRELWIEPARNPVTKADADNAALRAVLPCNDIEVVRDDRIFDAVRVACGRFGVIYSLVLEVRRQFRVVEVVTTPSAASVLQALRDGQGTPSIFTPLFRLLSADPVPAGFSDAQGVPYYLEILFNSQRPSDVWVRRRWETVTDGSSDTSFAPQGSKFDLAAAIVTVANAGLLAIAGVGGGTVAAVGGAVLTAVAGPLGTTIAGLLAADVSVEILNMVIELDRLVLSGNAAFESVLAAALTAAWRVPGAGYLIPQIQGMVIEDQLRGGQTVNGCRRGRHYLVSTGTKEDSDQTDFRSDSIEVVFDATNANYLAFLDEIFAVAPGFQQAGYIGLRPTLSSSALLSMHHVTGSRAVSIEVATVRNLPGSKAWMSYVHQAAIRHLGRPHWGQYNKLDPVETAMLYSPSLNPWREALANVGGTSTLFSNAFTRARGLEPVRMLREVTAVRKTRRGTITHLCAVDAPWSPVTVRQAIRDIRAGTAQYFARFEDSLVEIRVVAGRYLRTAADASERNNLDSLPDC